jgi:hypothetical protein
MSRIEFCVKIRFSGDFGRAVPQSPRRREQARYLLVFWFPPVARASVATACLLSPKPGCPTLVARSGPCCQVPSWFDFRSLLGRLPAFLVRASKDFGIIYALALAGRPSLAGRSLSTRRPDAIDLRTWCSREVLNSTSFKSARCRRRRAAAQRRCAGCRTRKPLRSNTRSN